MERPGFNPQALARSPDRQRSGADKEKEAARGGAHACTGAGRGI